MEITAWWFGCQSVEHRSANEVMPQPEVVDCLLEAALMREVGIAIAQVPLAEHRSAVAVGGEDVGHSRNTAADEGTPGTDRRGAAVQGVQASHQLTASRRAHWGDVEVGQPHTLAVQFIEVRCLDDRVTWHARSP